MLKRLFTALILLVIALPCIYFQGLPFRLLVTGFLLLGVWETLDLYRKTWSMFSFILMCLVLLISIAIVPALSAIMLLIIACSIILIKDSNVSIDQVAIVFMNSCLFILAINALKIIGDTMYGWFYIFIFAASLLCDTGAYFVGMSIGKHKLCPRLSPKKSVEGAIGGWIVGCLGSLAIAYGFTTAFSIHVDWTLLIACGLIIPLLSEIGDLYFSSIKRHVGIKDFGTIFPGHGGGLDRIDGLLFGLAAVPLIYEFVQFIQQIL